MGNIEVNPKQRKWKRFVLAGLKLMLVSTLLWMLLSFGWLDLTELEKALDHPVVLLLAALLILFGLFLTMLRWRLLLSVQGINLTAYNTVRLSFIGLFFSCVIPGSVSGDAVKAFYISREKHKPAEAISSVLADRVLGLFTFFVTASLAIIAGYFSNDWKDFFAQTEVQVASVVILSMTLMITVAFALLLSAKVRENSIVGAFINCLPFHMHINKLYVTLMRYRDKYSAFAFGISLLSQVMMVFATYLLGRAIGDYLTISKYFCLTPIGLVLNSIPVSPGGLVTGEAAYNMLFSASGSSNGAEIAALWHVMFFCWSLFGAVFYLFDKRLDSSEIENLATAN